MPEKTALSGLTREEISNLFTSLPSFRSNQIFSWIARGIKNFNQMTDLPLELREYLGSSYLIRSCRTENRIRDNDGTIKLVISLEDGIKIESVLLSDEKKRYTACLSTQAGCPVGCVFCKTGTLGFRRNLSAAEIVEQFFLLAEEIPEAISNIVIMGMGEPLLNLDNLRHAIGIISDPHGLNFSKRRITVSTSGIVKGIVDLADNGPSVRLAFSLVTADEKLRRLLIPSGASDSLEHIKESLLYFQRSGGGRITLEIVLLGGINTRNEDAYSLVEFTKGLNTVINLIPWNAIEPVPSTRPKAEVSRVPVFDTPLREPTKDEISGFVKHIRASGLKVTCRYRKGLDVSGACGQLGYI